MSKIENEKIKQATLTLLKELKQEIEKGETQEVKFSRVHELLAVVHEPVRFLASKEMKIRNCQYSTEGD